MATETTLAKAKNSILELLRSRKDGIGVDDLISELSGRGIDDPEQVKVAVWALISESAVELSPEYLLIVRRAA